MTKDIIIVEANKQVSDRLTKIEQLDETTRQVASNHKSPNTLNGYASDWEDFSTWCNAHQFQSLPAAPYVVAYYLADRAVNSWLGPSGKLKKLITKPPLKLPTLLHRVWAIKFIHKENGYVFDTSCKEIEAVLSGLRRTNMAKEDRKDPLLLVDIRGMIENLPETLTGIRDKALLLVGFVSAMRRSEIAVLKMQDLKFVEEGIEVHLSWSKTGERSLVIPYGSNPITCPVRALNLWLKMANITTGPIFRSINKHNHISEMPLTGTAIAIIVKRNVYLKNKIDVAMAKGEYAPSYSGHSLRAGFCTHAAMVGVPEHLIMAQAGHKKSDTTKKYIRIANKWTDNAAIKLGL